MSSMLSASSADTATNQLVIDASVAMKWFLDDEVDTDLAEAILAQSLGGSLELHAPELFRYEVDGALARACLTRFERGGQPRLALPDALDALTTLNASPIQYHHLALADRGSALSMAVDYSKGYYDMVYLNLAERLNCQWCTADSRILTPTRGGFPSHHIVILSSLRMEAS